MKSPEKLTLLTTPGEISLWRDSEHVSTDFVAAIKPEGGEPIYHDGIDPARSFNPIEVELPEERAERLVVLYQKLYVDCDTKVFYDCLSGMDFICGTDENLRYTHNYGAVEGVDSMAMEPGEPHIIIADNAAIHGILATDNTHAIHIAGPYSDMAYNASGEILQVWQGDLAQVTEFLEPR